MHPMYSSHSALAAVYKNYQVTTDPEITLEANPDDLTPEKINQLANSPINRLSIGVQSFFDEDLKLMNRAHSAKEAEESLALATRQFDNISIDLIYGFIYDFVLIPQAPRGREL